MGRREITRSFVLLAALGAAVLVVVEATRTSDGAADAARRAGEKTPVAAGDGVAAETAGSAEADSADRASTGQARTDEASRTAETPLEVDFLGLVMLRSTALDVPAEVGTIVLRNADPAAPPLRLELPVKDGRFQGRGPFAAVVEVERLVLSGRELAFDHRTWDLARRWIEVEASWTPPTLVHVVDAVEGMELKSVSLRPSKNSGPCRDFSVRSKGAGGGSDSPLVLVAASTTVVVHVAGYGDEAVAIGGDEREQRVEMKRPASIHVVVQPWPGEPVRNWRGETRSLRTVGIARVDAATLPSADRARSPGPRAGLAAKKAAASAWSERAGQARDAALLRAARLDRNGDALFEDLPGGTYLVWLGGADSSILRGAGSIRIVTVRGSVVSDPVELDPSDPMVDVTARPGERCEVTLPNRSFAEPPATIRVQAVDALDRQPIALVDDEVLLSRFEFADDAPSAWKRRARAAVAADGSGSGVLLYEVAAGAYVLSVNPLHHPANDPWGDFIDVQPGDNEITLALPRAQGVVVEIDVVCDDLRHRQEWLESVLPKLQCGGETLRPEAFWRETDWAPRRLVHRYAPLAAGQYELGVPDAAGWDRSGVIPLEVRENEVTTIELKLTPAAVSDQKR